MVKAVANRVIVTGGTAGVGLALVRQLAAKGPCVASVARTATNGEGVVAETGAHGIVADIGKKGGI
ncbi:MAG: SDR family NAD(P)-dependent oxidoreductase [Phyllobacterium sp.]|uniref:SDR family NAD(P)-dependent oxidoreductase n=1 Tax=Phyllobacterium sp. TaxID=1871046 RepID=UPI0030F2013D